MTMLFILNLMISMIFLFLTHPLSLGMMLLIQTILISLITGNLTMNFWFSYIIFLILIGGMLILFIYMTSIASNEKFNLNLKTMISMIMLMLFFFPNIFYYLNLQNNNNEINNFIDNKIINISLIKYINFPSNFIFLFLIMYLFLTLIISVKITNFKFGPLRQMN